VFIEFLKRLIAGPDRPIFLIIDRGSAHRANKTQAFVEMLGGKLRLFHLPPYSPDRNPDELVWKNLKADTVGHLSHNQQSRFQGRGRFFHVQPPEKVSKNPRLLPEALPQICRMNVTLLMDD
jgi:hypothetical protein